MSKNTDNTFEKRISKIEARNKRVEGDKQWETSWTRRITITTLTYIIVVLYLFIVDNPSPAVNAIVPAAGYMLSTLALGWLREIWHRA